MSKSKVALLAAYGMLAATAQQEQKDFLEFTNSYDGLPELKYSDSERKSYKKSQLTNKQKKKRAANKRAKQSRKRNR